MVKMKDKVFKNSVMSTIEITESDCSECIHHGDPREKCLWLLGTVDKKGKVKLCCGNFESKE